MTQGMMNCPLSHCKLNYHQSGDTTNTETLHSNLKFYIKNRKMMKTADLYVDPPLGQVPVNVRQFAIIATPFDTLKVSWARDKKKTHQDILFRNVVLQCQCRHFNLIFITSIPTGNVAQSGNFTHFFSTLFSSFFSLCSTHQHCYLANSADLLQLPETIVLCRRSRCHCHSWHRIVSFSLVPPPLTTSLILNHRP